MCMGTIVNLSLSSKRRVIRSKMCIETNKYNYILSSKMKELMNAWMRIGTKGYILSP
jgi:hypothetical protein